MKHSLIKTAEDVQIMSIITIDMCLLHRCASCHVLYDEAWCNNCSNYNDFCPDVRPLPDGCNPATWMLEISTLSAEQKLGQDLADLYRNSGLYRSDAAWSMPSAKLQQSHVAC